VSLLDGRAPGTARGGPTDRDRLEDEVGDLLFAAVSLSRKLDIRPEVALDRTLRKFCARFRRIEERFPQMETASLDQMEAVWQEAKSPNGEEGPHAG
jgi:ATP diphosphatase